MSRASRLFLAVVVLFPASSAFGQNTPARNPDAGIPRADAAPTEPAPAEEEEEGESDEPVRLRPPSIEEPSIAPPIPEEETESGEEQAVEAPEHRVTPPTTPAQAEPGLPAQSDPTQPHWTDPESVVTLHGYLRTRGEFQDSFHLGRTQLDADPLFLMWVPQEARPTAEVRGGCDGPMGTRCGVGPLAYGTMRLRLMPEVDLSDDVRVKMWFDVFDNMVLGSGADSSVFGGSGLGPRSPFAPLGVSTTTQLPPTYGVNSLQDSIVARRAWAEVRNRQIGELRFGRMGFHWGLGMFANAGDTIDSDYSTDVDRVMGVLKIAGLYAIVAYDFASSGFAQMPGFAPISSASRPDPEAGRRGGFDPALRFDPSSRDNVNQFMAAVARRATPEDQRATLAAGGFVLNAGAFFAYRTQKYSFVDSTPLVGATPTTDGSSQYQLVARGSEVFIPDAWVQFLWGKLRIEAELAMTFGTLANSSRSLAIRTDNYSLLQAGFALEAEYRGILANEQLALHFAMGYASGDADSEGLSAFDDQVTQVAPSQDRTVSTFAFHPNYRVDLIFFRNIMRRVAGAYYIRPGVSYDFIRSPFGQLLGGRLDVIYSRASAATQTWGNSDDLGLEFDASLYFRSEDGPDLLDGFYVQVQYGLFFPFGGLGYLSNARTGATERTDGPTGGNPGLANAQTIRLLLGVQF